MTEKEKKTGKKVLRGKETQLVAQQKKLTGGLKRKEKKELEGKERARERKTLVDLVFNINTFARSEISRLTQGGG